MNMHNYIGFWELGSFVRVLSLLAYLDLLYVF